MACPRLLLSADEHAGDQGSLACRRSVSWYGLRLNIIQETSETGPGPPQVRPRAPALWFCPVNVLVSPGGVRSAGVGEPF